MSGGGASTPDGARMAPFHCPYCGEEDLRPAESAGPGTGAAWECRSCARAFGLTFLGLTTGGAPS